LLKFDGQPQKDEEMYEHAFGKLLVSNEDDETGATASSTSAGSIGQTAAQRKVRTTGSKNSGASSEEGETGYEIKNETSNDQSNGGSNPESDVDGSEIEGKRTKGGRKSAREQRSKRRQAKIDVDIVPGLSEALFAGETQSVLPSVLQHKRQRLGGAEVVKVKLLTGTLYLYRGPQRRAEFIRRV
jgi:hypothetical protein